VGAQQCGLLSSYSRFNCWTRLSIILLLECLLGLELLFAERVGGCGGGVKALSYHSAQDAGWSL